MANILVIDDDRMLCDMLCRHVEYLKHKAAYALTLKEGFDLLQRLSFDVVFLDVRLPDGNGLNALPKIREMSCSPDVIIITGEGDPDGAELAIKSGAWDYLQKPLSPNKITLPLSRVLQYRDSVKKAQKPLIALKRKDIVGDSPKITACLDSVAQAAEIDANVMITGETGTGKELFAKAIHDNGPRVSGNFVVVDCTALPETLVESTLFGYEKGAFTGADKSRTGLIGQADGGTLFLDEVGELDIGLQKAFLRVLQERRFRPLGSQKELQSNFRLISATNRGVDQMVTTGQFREDLLYRLRTILIELPPLRQRREDIKALAVHYCIQICNKYGMESKGFSPDFFDVLWAYPWPGNVRELVNALEESISRAQQEPTLFPQHLPDQIRVHVARSAVDPKEKGTVPDEYETIADLSNRPSPHSNEIPTFRTFHDTVLADKEKEYFRKLMKAARGNIQHACQISGLGRSRLYALLKKYNISRF